MAKPKKREKHLFRRFMLLYILLFALLIVLMLRFGWQYLTDYEAAQPQVFMDGYLQTLDAAHLRAIAEQSARNDPYPLISAEELTGLLVSQLQPGDYSYARDKSVKIHNGYRYILLLDGEKKGAVTIRHEDNPNFYTFEPWYVESEEGFYTLPEREAVEFTIPESWQIAVNGVTLDESSVVETGLMIPGLEDYYDESYAPAYLVTYRVSEYLNINEVRVCNAEGQPQQLAERVEDNAALFAAELFDNDNEDVQALVREYIVRYVRYSSNTNRNASGNLSSLRELIVPGSDLDQRMQEVLDALYWTVGRGYEIKEIRFNSILHVDGAWVADVTYVTDVNGQNGEVTTTVNNARFTVVEQNGKLLVERHKVY